MVHHGRSDQQATKVPFVQGKNFGNVAGQDHSTFASSSVAISLNHVRKQYGAATALHDISLTINDKEFFTLLGPSGCGKTTLLRIIAGFESVSGGTVQLYGKEIAGLAANERPINTVFQQYSLFPHMSVVENVLFGLQMRKVPAAQARKRVDAMLELVQLEDFAHRMPSQLSGGQQQRVALARALAPEPEVLLLDEPLSALDLKLRQAMRLELKQIQEEAGITFIFVTHDQEEALTLSDRIAVMSAGAIQQVGNPQDIYESPVNRFVADFIGESNLLEATLVDQNNTQLTCALPGGTQIMVDAPGAPRIAEVGASCLVCIRPEKLKLLSSDSQSSEALQGTVERHIYLGTDTQLMVRLVDGQLVQLRAQNAAHTFAFPTPGSAVRIGVELGSARFIQP